MAKKEYYNGQFCECGALKECNCADELRAEVERLKVLCRRVVALNGEYGAAIDCALEEQAENADIMPPYCPWCDLINELSEAVVGE